MKTENLFDVEWCPLHATENSFTGMETLTTAFSTRVSLYKITLSLSINLEPWHTAKNLSSVF